MTIVLSWTERILGALTIIVVGYVFCLVGKAEKKDAIQEVEE